MQLLIDGLVTQLLCNATIIAMQHIIIIGGCQQQLLNKFKFI
jgi:hypothetical protein